MVNGELQISEPLLIHMRIRRQAEALGGQMEGRSGNGVVKPITRQIKGIQDIRTSAAERRQGPLQEAR